MIVIMCNLVNDGEIIKTMLRVLVVCYFVVIAFGVYESLTGHYFFVNKSAILSRMSILKYRAPLVFFTNQNDFSLFVVFGIFLVSAPGCMQQLELFLQELQLFQLHIVRSSKDSLAESDIITL